jgi:hypothetical protein
MEVKSKFNLKETVFVKTDPEQMPHLITAFRVDDDGILYEASYIQNRAYYQHFELSKQRDVLKVCGVEDGKATN